MLACLRQRGRLTYRTFLRQFPLDAAPREALMEAMRYSQRLAVDEAGVEDVPQRCQVRTASSRGRGLSPLS
jgi:hypothetical protein